jgi:hypothetical protein
VLPRLSRCRPGRERAAPRELAERFTKAFSSGDGSALTTLLAEDVGLWSDGGGKASAARRALMGRDEVLNFLLGLYRTTRKAGIADVSIRIIEANEEPAIVLRAAGRLASVFVVSIDHDRVSGIRVVRNPDKLAYIDHQLESPDLIG